MIKIVNLFDLEHTMAKEYLAQYVYPWEALPLLAEYIRKLGNTLAKEDYQELAGDIWIHKTASVSASASITGPCIIGANTQIRHCAFIRESVIIGERCVVGNSVELKNVILFNEVQTPHYNYVGDSILGYQAHMGAGSITSNVKGDKSLVEIKMGDEKILTNRKKVGAFLGDGVEIGCNSVLNPGTVVGKNTRVYPLTSVRGVIGANHIVKNNDEIIQVF